MQMPKSKTDWERVRREAEADTPIPYDDEDRAEGLYDPNDEQAVAKAWAEGTVTRGVRGKQVAPTKQLISIRLSPEVVTYFKESGAGWQTRLDEALLKIVKRQKAR